MKTILDEFSHDHYEKDFDSLTYTEQSLILEQYEEWNKEKSRGCHNGRI